MLTAMFIGYWVWMLGVVGANVWIKLSKSELAESLDGPQLSRPAVVFSFGWPVFLLGLALGALSCLGASAFLRGWNSVADQLLVEEEE